MSKMLIISEEMARLLANSGIPTAGITKRSDGRAGHVWMVLPTPEGETLRAANVGSENYFNEPFKYDHYTEPEGYEPILYTTNQKDFALLVLQLQEEAAAASAQAPTQETRQGPNQQNSVDSEAAQATTETVRRLFGRLSDALLGKKPSRP